MSFTIQRFSKTKTYGAPQKKSQYLDSFKLARLKMKSDFFVIAFHVAAKNRWLKIIRLKLKRKYLKLLN